MDFSKGVTFEHVWEDGRVSVLPNIAFIPGKKEDVEALRGLELAEVLVSIDFPLLLLANGPPITRRPRRKERTEELPTERSKWLLNWCDYLPPDAGEEQIPKSIYLAFRVSDQRLSQFLGSHISLREAILHCEYEMYLYTAQDPLKPINAKSVDPIELATNFVPSRNFALNGEEVFSLDQQKMVPPLNIAFHIIPKTGSDEHLPWITSGPFQTHFQHYLSFAAHFMKQKGKVNAFPLDVEDWTILNTRIEAAGSYRIFCDINTASSKDSSLLSKACELLKQVTEISGAHKEVVVAEIDQVVGTRAMDDLYALLAFVSKQGIAVTIDWGSTNNIQELMLNKRVADRAIKLLRKMREKDPERATLTIKLTDLEKEYLLKPVTGAGGWQSSLRAIQRKIVNNTLSLTADEVDKIVKQAQSYGQGGFQDRLNMVIAAISRWETSFSGMK